MAEPAALPRGFPAAEFRHRLARAQAAMADDGLDALWLTTEPEIRWFTGFLTPFWQSPTRPWFLVVPARGRPVAVIPEIGAAAMAATWIETIRTWPSPRPADEGVALLAGTLEEVAGARGRIGLPMGPETHLRMPLADFRALQDRLPGAAWVDATALLARLRRIKSPAEIARIADVCDRVSGVFEAMPGWLAPGMAEAEVFRRFRIACLEAGADAVPYLVGGAGPDGYADVISPPGNRPLAAGDILMLDTGTVIDGYFCDFDRNVAIGAPSDAARRAHALLFEATEAGFAAARPGATCGDLFAAMRGVLARGGAADGAVGRMGHGLGMQLTEGPSILPDEATVLEPGMVMTLEPAMAVAPGRLMVHEENIVIGEDGPRLLTRRAPAELPVVAA